MWPHLNEHEAQIVEHLSNAATLVRMASDLSSNVEQEDTEDLLARSLPRMTKKLNQLWEQLAYQG
jgi:hypothetical protein